jgi:hypothetical protein
VNTRCTFVNGQCPSDLCILPYGHPFSRQNRHLTGTMYGSINTSYDDQIDLLRTRDWTQWSSELTEVAPEGTSDEQLMKLGWKLQEKKA